MSISISFMALSKALAPIRKGLSERSAGFPCFRSVQPNYPSGFFSGSTVIGYGWGTSLVMAEPGRAVITAATILIDSDCSASSAT